MHAVLDLGSNSFHLLVAEEKKGGVKFLKAMSYKVRLAEGVNLDGKISKDARERALKAFQAIREELDNFAIHQICVVGTSTFREAKNAARIIEDAREYGFGVQVISGIQEAYYIYHGVQSFFHGAKKSTLVFDIGGGSTEFAFGSGNRPQLVDSITLGCVTNNFVAGEDDTFTLQNLVKLRLRAHNILEKQLKSAFYTLDWQECYVTSGTAKMLSAILRENKFTDGTITRSALQTLENTVLSFESPSVLQGLAGLKPNRHKVFASGLANMQAIMDHLEIDKVKYVSFALREGVLLGMIKKGKDFSLISKEEIEVMTAASL